MANSATRINGTVEISCDSCGSTGTSPAAKFTKIPIEGAAEKREAYAAEVAQVRAGHERKLKALGEKAKRGVNIKPELEALRADTEGKIAALAAGNPTAMFTFRVDTCPWCDKPLGVDVVDAPPAEAAA